MSATAATNGYARQPPHLRAAADRHRGLGRRRQVDPDRPAAARLQVDPRGSARARPADLRAPRRRVPQPRAAHRRPARRARAGHHDRRRLPLLPDPAAQVHHRRHPGPRAVHPQHGHRRLDRRRVDRARRRAQGRLGADPPPRLHLLAAADPARRRVRQQDGPGRLRRGRLLPHPRGDDRLGGAAADPGHDLHPDLGAQRRQRRRALAADAVVRRPRRCSGTSSTS